MNYFFGLGYSTHVGTSDCLGESEACNPEARSRYFKRLLAGGAWGISGFPAQGLGFRI